MSAHQNNSLAKMTGLILLFSALVIWLVVLLQLNADHKVEYINYNDVVSEVFAIGFLLLLLLVNIKINNTAHEANIIYVGFCCMLVGHGHDLIDEFVNIQPEWISLMLENVMTNLGIVIVAVAIFKWSQRYREEVMLLNKQTEILTDASNTDPLTKLYNRRFLNNEFIQTIITGTQHNTLTLLLVDLDHFKKVNDSYGHTVGDNMIKYMADVIRGEIREQDYAFRYGGEEFLVVLDCNREMAYKVAERIRRDFSESIFEVEGVNIPKSTSIGLFELPTGMAFEKAIDIADKALYKAKEEGRNQVVEGEKNGR